MGQYTVQPGDSWARIAQNVYGEGRYAVFLMGQNQNSSYVMHAGDVIDVPDTPPPSDYNISPDLWNNILNAGSDMQTLSRYSNSQIMSGEYVADKSPLGETGTPGPTFEPPEPYIDKKGITREWGTEETEVNATSESSKIQAPSSGIYQSISSNVAPEMQKIDPETGVPVPLPVGALGWLPSGEPLYGAGLGGVANQLFSKIFDPTLYTTPEHAQELMDKYSEKEAGITGDFQRAFLDAEPGELLETGSKYLAGALGGTAGLEAFEMVRWMFPEYFADDMPEIGQMLTQVGATAEAILDQPAGQVYADIGKLERRTLGQATMGFFEVWRLTGEVPVRKAVAVAGAALDIPHLLKDGYNVADILQVSQNRIRASQLAYSFLVDEAWRAVVKLVYNTGIGEGGQVLRDFVDSAGTLTNDTLWENYRSMVGNLPLMEETISQEQKWTNWVELAGSVFGDWTNIIPFNLLGKLRFLTNSDIIAKPVGKLLSPKNLETVVKFAETAAENADHSGDVAKIMDDVMKTTREGIDNIGRRVYDSGLTTLSQAGKRFVFARGARMFEKVVLGKLKNNPDNMARAVKAMIESVPNSFDNVDDIAKANAANLELLKLVGPGFLSEGGTAFRYLLKRMAGNDLTKFAKEFLEKRKSILTLSDWFTSKYARIVDDLFPSFEDMEKASKAVDDAVATGEKLDNKVTFWSDIYKGIRPSVRRTMRFTERLAKPYSAWNRFFSLVYMGMSPGYAMRNLFQNSLHVFLDQGATAGGKSLYAQIAGVFSNKVYLKGLEEIGEKSGIKIPSNITSVKDKIKYLTDKLPPAVSQGIGFHGAEVTHKGWDFRDMAAKVEAIAGEQIYLSVLKREIRKASRFGFDPGSVLIKNGMTPAQADLLGKLFYQNDGNVEKTMAAIREASKYGLIPKWRVDVPENLAKRLQEIGLYDEFVERLKSVDETPESIDNLVAEFKEKSAQYASSRNNHVFADLSEEDKKIVEHLIPEEDAGDIERQEIVASLTAQQSRFQSEVLDDATRDIDRLTKAASQGMTSPVEANAMTTAMKNGLADGNPFKNALYAQNGDTFRTIYNKLQDFIRTFQKRDEIFRKIMSGELLDNLEGDYRKLYDGITALKFTPVDGSAPVPLREFLRTADQTVLPMRRVSDFFNTYMRRNWTEFRHNNVMYAGKYILEQAAKFLDAGVINKAAYTALEKKYAAYQFLMDSMPAMKHVLGPIELLSKEASRRIQNMGLVAKRLGLEDFFGTFEKPRSYQDVLDDLNSALPENKRLADLYTCKRDEIIDALASRAAKDGTEVGDDAISEIRRLYSKSLQQKRAEKALEMTREKFTSLLQSNFAISKRQAETVTKIFDGLEKLAGLEKGTLFTKYFDNVMKGGRASLWQIGEMSPAMRRWLGDSKWMEPAYHGRSGSYPIESWEPAMGRYGVGIYFDPMKVDNYDEAAKAGIYDPEHYARRSALIRQRQPGYRGPSEISGENIVPVYLKVRNPYIVQVGETHASLFDWKATEKLKQEGYDGVFAYYKGQLAEIVVWDKSQIKSVFSSAENLLNQKVGGVAKAGISWGENLKATLHAFEKPDVSSPIHEAAHFAIEMINDVIIKTGDEFLSSQMKVIEKFAGVKNGEWTTKAHEKIAKAFEKYMLDGKAPENATPEIVRMFKEIKNWLVEIYQNALEGIKVSDEVRKVFDSWVTGERKGVEVVDDVTSAAQKIEVPKDIADKARQLGVKPNRIYNEKLSGIIYDVERSAEFPGNIYYPNTPLEREKMIGVIRRNQNVELWDVTLVDGKVFPLVRTKTLTGVLGGGGRHTAADVQFAREFGEEAVAFRSNERARKAAEAAAEALGKEVRSVSAKGQTVVSWPGEKFDWQKIVRIEPVEGTIAVEKNIYRTGDLEKSGELYERAMMGKATSVEAAKLGIDDDVFTMYRTQLRNVRDRRGLYEEAVEKWFADNRKTETYEYMKRAGLIRAEDVKSGPVEIVGQKGTRFAETQIKGEAPSVDIKWNKMMYPQGEFMDALLKNKGLESFKEEYELLERIAKEVGGTKSRRVTGQLSVITADGVEHIVYKKNLIGLHFTERGAEGQLFVSDIYGKDFNIFDAVELRTKTKVIPLGVDDIDRHTVKAIEDIDARERLLDQLYENQTAEQRLADELDPSMGESVAGRKKIVKTALDKEFDNWAEELKSGGMQDAVDITDNEVFEKALNEWSVGATRREIEMQSVAHSVAQAERDFALHAYGDKLNIEFLINKIYPYSYWYMREYPRMFARLLNDPRIANQYLKYRRFLEGIHAGMPDWWKYQLSTADLPGADVENPTFLNLESTFNPMYGLTGVDFNDPKRRIDWLTSTVDTMGKMGPSLFTPLNWLMAGSLYLRGEEEAGRRWFGRVFPQTILLKSIAYKLGVRTGLPYNELDPAVQIFSGGLDWSERNRVGRVLGEMLDMKLPGVDQRAITEAAYLQEGPVWEQAVALSQDKRFMSNITSYVFGAGFKTRTQTDVEIDTFYGEYYRLMDFRDNLSPLEYKDALTALRTKYPFMDTVLISRKQDDDRDTAYAYSVFARIAPGQRDELFELVGLPYETYQKFYDNKGVFEGFTTKEKNDLTDAVFELGAILELPDSATSLEWNRATVRYQEAMDFLSNKYGDDIHDKITAYFQAENKDEYGQKHPEVVSAMEDKDKMVLGDPMLAQYYSSIDVLERYYAGKITTALEKEYGDVDAKFEEWERLKLEDAIAGTKTAQAFWKANKLSDYLDDKNALWDAARKQMVEFQENLPERRQTRSIEDLSGASGVGEDVSSYLGASKRTWPEWSKMLTGPMQELLMEYFDAGEEIPDALWNALEDLNYDERLGYNSVGDMIVDIGTAYRQR